MSNTTIGLYLITGFLGSGKTTLLKNLLSHLRGEKVAVIVNEFASKGVDGTLLDKEGFVLSEVSGGSVFCTCKSDAFIDAIWALSDRDIDILLVETSGMADPSSMPDMMKVIRKKTERIQYRGCITIASAENIHKLMKTSRFVINQIRFADVVLINKSDLVTEPELSDREEDIRKLNAFCKIYTASFCNIPDPNILLKIQHSGSMRDVPSSFQTYGSTATERFVMEFEDAVEENDLIKFLDLYRHDFFRIKGFVHLNDQRTVLIDGVGENIKIVPSDSVTDGSFLVFIYPNDKPMPHIIKKAYKKIFGSEPSIP